MTLPAFLVGTGHASPQRRVGNAEIEAELALESGWIERRTGIVERRICGPDESCSTLATTAGARALQDAGMDPADLGLVVLATSTPDHLLPPTAPVVARRLGAHAAGGFDLAGACAGFLYGLGVGASWAATLRRPVLVVAANVLSRRLDPTDAGARAVFADGAGAVVVSPEPGPNCGRLRSIAVGADATHADAIRVTAGGSVRPMDLDAVREGLHFLRIERGSIVFQEAVRGMVRAARAALADAGTTTDAVDLWIPHQANRRILERVGRELAIDDARRVEILDRWGNSSAASIPTAMSIHRETAAPTGPSTWLLTAVGAGLVEAAAVIDWTKD